MVWLLGNISLLFRCGFCVGMVVSRVEVLLVCVLLVMVSYRFRLELLCRWLGRLVSRC